MTREVKPIKYRFNEFYQPRFKGSVFSEEEDELALDEEKDQIVVVGKVNIQEAIQSHEDCALDKILDKYLNEDGEFTGNRPEILPDNGVLHEHKNPDLADLGEEYERVEILKEQYNIDPALSYEQTLQALKNKKAELDAYLLKVTQQEVQKDETTQDEQTQK